MCIDSFVLFVIGVVLWIATLTVSWSIDSTYDPSGTFYLVWFAASWMYLVPLKRSRFRTIAYRLLNLKIVSTSGERPSLFTMTFRMLMWLLGPFNLFLDLLWLGADTEGQSLRDCFASTYVVQCNAEPIGVAPIHLARYNAVGFNLSYPRVCRPVSPTQDSR